MKTGSETEAGLEPYLPGGQSTESSAVLCCVCGFLLHSTSVRLLSVENTHVGFRLSPVHGDTQTFFNTSNLSVVLALL